MANMVTFETRKPVALSTQIKTFGRHENIPMTQNDVIKAIMAGAEPVLTSTDPLTGEVTEVALTFENLAEYVPADYDPTAPEEEKEPGEDIVTTSGTYVFLNGTAGVICLDDEGNTILKAKTSNGVVKSYPLAANSSVCGGSKLGSVASSNITMTGGIVNSIFGAGLGDAENFASVDDVKINITGGKVTNVVAGGGLLASRCKNVSICMSDCTAGNVQGGGMAYHNSTSAGEKLHPEDSKNSCENVKIELNRVTLPGSNACVFLGGQGYSYVANAEGIINDIDISSGYCVTGGSNGRTDHAKLTINGGKFNVLQSINRGFMVTSETIINGGEIKKAFAGGEDPESWDDGNDVVNGFFTDEASISLTINGGTINELHTGSNGENTIVADDPIVHVYVGANAIVENIEDAKTAFGTSLTVA